MTGEEFLAEHKRLSDIARQKEKEAEAAWDAVGQLEAKAVWQLQRGALPPAEWCYECGRRVP